jgi:hypothetical protein
MKRTKYVMAVLVMQWAMLLNHKEAAQPAHAADRLVENSLTTVLGFAPFQFLLGALCHPAAADAQSLAGFFGNTFI